MPMQVRVKETTDGKHVGEVWTLPAGFTLLEQLTPAVVEQITAAGGRRFDPDVCVVRADGTLRATNSNYSIVLEEV